MGAYLWQRPSVPGPGHRRLLTWAQLSPGPGVLPDATGPPPPCKPAPHRERELAVKVGEGKEPGRDRGRGPGEACLSSVGTCTQRHSGKVLRGDAPVASRRCRDVSLSPRAPYLVPAWRQERLSLSG